MNTNEDLAKAIWSEAGLMELLGCTKKQVRRLTLEDGLPGIRLERGLYVYLAGDVLKWLAAKKSSQGSAVCLPENSPPHP